ncbi:hypothetical protein X975_16954, partial [Stegodyphus mimosarum]
NKFCLRTTHPPTLVVDYVGIDCARILLIIIAFTQKWYYAFNCMIRAFMYIFFSIFV